MWANGAEIQRLWQFGELKESRYTPEWRDDPDPKWLWNVEYRIKASHPNQDVIYAWKLGSEVQARYIGNVAWMDMVKYEDSSFTNANEGVEYRFKPEDIVVEKQIWLYQNVSLAIDNYSTKNNVRFTFDPDTHKLTKVELIKD